MLDRNRIDNGPAGGGIIHSANGATGEMIGRLPPLLQMYPPEVFIGDVIADGRRVVPQRALIESGGGVRLHLPEQERGSKTHMALDANPPHGTVAFA